MPYTNTQSVIAADMNNCLRGLYQDNTTHSLTGTTNETTLATVSITGGTITATGGLHIVAAGTITNIGGSAKTIKLYLGASVLGVVSRTGANDQDWLIDAWCFNTATNAQRWIVVFSTTDLVTLSSDYTASSIDTASNATLKVTGTLVGATDQLFQTMFIVQVIQVT